MRLYHGTAAAFLPSIREHGIRPRRKGKGNYQHSVESNPKGVYLTNAYAPYFAYNATQADGASLAVVEVDTERLDALLLQPDEDWLEQVTRKAGPAPLDKPMKFRTRWYRARLAQYRHHWLDSIAGLGSCNYPGTIPPEAITRAVTITEIGYMRMIFHRGMDPTIHVMNYRILGERYRDSMKWLFGDIEDGEPPSAYGVEAVEMGETV